jgi:hypothetical protein
MLPRVFCVIALSCLPVSGAAQYIPKEFLAFDVSAGAGKGLVQGNASIAQHWGLGRKKRSHIFIGLRANFIRNTADFSFSPPRSPEPELNYTFRHVNIGSINLMTGFRASLTARVSLGISAELLGISFGSNETGTITLQETQLPFEAQPLGTNMLLNGSKAGSLLHTIELGYAVTDNFMIKAGFASQSAVYDFKSELEGFKHFTKISQTYGLLVSVEWMVDCKR